MSNKSVIIVENDSATRNQLMQAFEERGYLTWTCPTAETAISIFSVVQPDIVLLDLDLEGGGAMELLDCWKMVAPDTHIIVESAASDSPRMRQAKDCGADAFFVKPLALPPLFEGLEKAIDPPNNGSFMPHAA
jgi:DNA-binding NtrC family response regulator